MPPLVSEGLNLALYGMGTCVRLPDAAGPDDHADVVAGCSQRKQSPLLRCRLIQLAPEKWLRSPQRSTCIETEHPHRLKFKF